MAETLTLLRRLPPRLARWAVELYAAATAFDLDAILLAAIMDRESLGGDALTPPTPAGTGDHGNGRGLMQVDDRAHPAFIATGLWKHAGFNVFYGGWVLRQALTYFKGELPLAIAAYNAGPGKVAAAVRGIEKPEERLAAADRCTTGGDYASDVLRRRERFYLEAAS